VDRARRAFIERCATKQAAEWRTPPGLRPPWSASSSLSRSGSRCTTWFHEVRHLRVFGSLAIACAVEGPVSIHGLWLLSAAAMFAIPVQVRMIQTLGLLAGGHRSLFRARHSMTAASGPMGFTFYCLLAFAGAARGQGSGQ